VVWHLRRSAGRQTAAGTTDADLLDRFVARRDEAAFELLVWRHERMVSGVCRRVLRHEHDADDACQAAFLTLACKAGSIGRRQAVGGWLYQVAYRIALRARNDAQRRGRLEIKAAEHGAFRMSADPAHDASQQDLRSAVDAEVSRLPAKYRTPIVLCYLEGKTNEEAAQLLGCRPGTLATWLARARERLRTRLARRGLEVSAGTLAAVLAAPDGASAAPPAFLQATVRAAVLFAGDRMAAGVVSDRVAFLTRGALKAMALNKLTVVTEVLLGLCLVGTGSAVLARAALPAAPEAAQPVGAPQAPAPASAPAAAAPAPEPLPAPGEEGQAKEEKWKDEKKKDDKKKDNRQKAEEVVIKSFKTGRAPKVVVEVFNGGIEIVSQAESAVDARVVKKGEADTKEEAEQAVKDIDVKMTQDRDTVHITASRPEEKDRHRQHSAAAEVRVPAGAVLELQTSNGSITLAAGAGDAKVHTSNGSIRATDRAGALNLTTGNGSVVVRKATGRVEVKTTNGHIELQDVPQVVSARTSNAAIRFDGSLADGSHKFNTSNAKIALTLPADARFRVEAATSNGTIATDFLPSSGGSSRRSSLRGTVGDNPAVAIELGTSNGSIEIRKKK
jgi:RNA polymerase sigma factor (sigma-70 family)